LRKVVGVKKREEIDQEIGVRAGEPGYMAGYAEALTTVLGRMTEEEKKEHTKIANDWNKSHPPREVQTR
jgi:hypothetical protein